MPERVGLMPVYVACVCTAVSAGAAASDAAPLLPAPAEGAGWHGAPLLPQVRPAASLLHHLFVNYLSHVDCQNSPLHDISFTLQYMGIPPENQLVQCET